MKKSAILLFSVMYCAFSLAQGLQFSRKFQAVKKNVPVTILNTRPDCFFVLRYNQAVHDFTIERRAKPSAEIMAFTPLKLDSVNASWFDYNNLDYLFFEQNRQLYFLFEKVVNTRRTIYLKVIDTTAHSSGFIELASLEKEKNIQDYRFTYKTTAGNNILIIASQVFYNGTIKKTVMLYDVEKRRMAWTRKLPLENDYTGYSRGFESNGSGLFYVLCKSRIVSFRRKYAQQLQLNVPVFFHDTITLVSYPGDEQPLIHKAPLLANVSGLNSISLLPGQNDVIVLAHVALQTGDSAPTVYFFTRRLSADLEHNYYMRTTPLDNNLQQQLTFYDGSDYNMPSDKEYGLLKNFTSARMNYQVSARRDEDFYKELLVWQTDLVSGNIRAQYIVPRKIMSFRGRTRYKNIGEAMLVFAGENLNLIVLESGANYRKTGAFNYHQFKKETNLWRSNLVMYTIHEGQVQKQLVYRNSEFDLVPLVYRSKGQEDVVFYLSSGKYEKFAILKLNPS